MILLIDIGNSRIKCAIFNGGELMLASPSVYTDRELPLDCFSDINQRPEAIYIASVAGEWIENHVIKLCSELWNEAPKILHTQSHCCGVINGYAIPAVLGVDRWAAIIGAYQLVGDALLVIDCGTACSVDFVDHGGLHLGGAIIPGVQMMQNSLQLGTARIESTDDGPGVYSLGDTTNGCIQYGVSEAVLGFIERMERMAFSLCGDGVTVIITGGDAAGLLPHLHGNIRYVKDLVFLGMAGIVEEMRGGKAL